MSFVRSTQKLLNKAPELYPLFGIIGLGVGLCGAMMGRTLMFNKEIMYVSSPMASTLSTPACPFPAPASHLQHTYLLPLLPLPPLYFSASPTKASSYLKQAAEHDGSKSWREGKLFKGSLNSMEMFTFRPNAGNL
eukprot:TRINITY_DN11380_c0_g2_i1.p1 TRINITY_DN11380_c0_g2~~TRINITY_DN11380_c0_g2_i1.p1  ORF type:complete len:149 (+),score=15.30 TRINITY_DN11380_c0_g2_i1:43-447(+)